MFDVFFELLFKYRPFVFEQGEFAFRSSLGGGLAALAAVAGGFLALRTYARVRGGSRPLDRRVLTAIRLSALVVVVFCLLHPVLVVSSVVPQQNFLGVLIDDSRSMQIADRESMPRLQFVRDELAAEDGELRAALAERFELRFFGFAAEVDRLNDIDELSFNGTRTHLGDALERANEELSGVPLSGLVVVTDGADNADDGLDESLLPIQAAGVPVFAIGLGREEYERDIQLSRVETPRRVLKGAAIVVDCVVTHRGFRGETVTVQVEDEGRIVGSEEVELAGDDQPRTVRMRFTASEEGPRLFTFRVSTQADEMVVQNNVRNTLILVEDHSEKILYFEGEPRFEVKFLRRAVADDENLHVSILQRTAENKFMRLDVESADDLVGGFPTTRAELYKYSGIILGSIEANYFTPDQLRMIADFVNNRGGGLLMLGSQRSFAEGGYVGTPVADVLPVVLDTARAEDTGDFFVEVNVATTRAGVTHAATQISETEELSAERWQELPPITIVNPIGEVKPGATTLLTSEDEELVVLAFQRYGAGKSLAFSVQDSWMWQMHADIAVDDMTHEIFWRRLLRWLVDGVPDQVTIDLPNEQVEQNEPVEILASVGDANFEELNNSSVMAVVTHPSGDFTDLRMEWTAETDGEYRAEFTPVEEGFYEVRVEAMSGEEVVGEDVTFLQVSPSDAEYYDSTMRTSLLDRITEETGGRRYTASTAASLPEDIRYVGGGVTVVEENDLWDMPALLLLLVSLVLGEWGYRRFRGLA